MIFFVGVNKKIGGGGLWVFLVELFWEGRQYIFLDLIVVVQLQVEDLYSLILSKFILLDQATKEGAGIVKTQLLT